MRGGELGWTFEDNELINNAIRQMSGKLDRDTDYLAATFPSH